MECLSCVTSSDEMLCLALQAVKCTGWVTWFIVESRRDTLSQGE